MRLLLALFFGSGFSALVYQVLWQRQLGLVFGVTAYATSAVLAAFMAGLALGSWAAGRLSSRIARPLLAFGVCEVLVGLSALATPLWLDAARIAYVWVARLIPDSFVALTTARLLCSLLVLLVPTTLMGATLPLVVKSSLGRSAAVGGRLATLYGVNTFGALSGALVTGFWLIGQFGIGASYTIAALVNGLVAVAAIGAGWREAPLVAPSTASSAATSPSARDAGERTAAAASWSREQRAALVVAALSGGAALALEVVWVRWLVLFLPATTYAFSTMLGVVLAGIATGSMLAARLLRTPRRWLEWLAAAEACTALAAVGMAVVMSRTFAAGWHTSATLQGSIVTMFPAALMMGVALPFAIRVFASRTGDGAEDSALVGRIYAVNVMGGIVGALLAGFVLLPALGSRYSLVCLSGVFLLAGLVAWRATPSGPPGARWSKPLAATAAFVLLAAQLPDAFDSALQRSYPAGERVFWHEEGVQTTVSVHMRPMGGRLLYLNGLHQASDGADVLHMHRLIGLLPLAIHPNPRHALVVGLGGGATAGASSRHIDTHVDVVELSDSVVHGAAWFAHINENILENDKVSLIVDDGRNYLMLTDSRYDVITADLIQPEHAGAGNLFSREYFELARRALAEDGLMLQWVGHRPETSYKLIVRTFMTVFPETTLWADGHLLVGSKGPIRLDRARYEEKLRDTRTREALEEMGLGTFDRLLASFVAGPADLQRFVGEGDILTDDRPVIEYHRALPANDPPIQFEGLRGDVTPYVARSEPASSRPPDGVTGIVLSAHPR
jgi:spermidine synthase